MAEIKNNEIACKQCFKQFGFNTTRIGLMKYYENYILAKGKCVDKSRLCKDGIGVDCSDENYRKSCPKYCKACSGKLINF